MTRSRVTFNRWAHIRLITWPFQVYKKYNEELSDFLWVQSPVQQYIFSRLQKESAILTDECTKYFKFPPKCHNFTDIASWKGTYNQFEKWIYLNCIMALSSNFETYLNAVISLAIESDPGVLLGAPKSIDGAKLLKSQSLNKTSYNQQIKLCTSGTWSNRMCAFKKLFGSVPAIMNSELASLDRLRALRNKVGHAFGRDIEKAHSFEVNTILPMETIQLKTLIKYLNITYDIAQAVDKFLLDNHIGEFQDIIAYHKLYPSLDSALPISEKAVRFKKMIGKIDIQKGKTYCKGLVQYYDEL